MARPKLLLHPGMHKTGTTAIQESLSRNRDWLATQGVAYPDLRRPDDGPKSSHHNFAGVLASGAAPSDPELRRHTDQVDRAAAQARLTVLSAESIYIHTLAGHPQKPGRLQNLRWFVDSRIGFWAAHRKYLERFRDEFGAFDVSVLIYFRRPDAVAESLFKERIAGGRQTPSFALHVKQLQWGLRFFDYARRLNVLRGVFDRVDTRCYEVEAKSGLVAGFYTALGVEAPEPEPAGGIRASVGNRATLWLRRERIRDKRRLRMHRYRVLFAAENRHSPVFAEPEPSTLWRSDRAFRAFVKRNRSAYDIVDFDPPELPGRPKTVWTKQMHGAANEAFAGWLRANAERLKRRDEAGRTRYWEPDPAQDA